MSALTRSGAKAVFKSSAKRRQKLSLQPLFWSMAANSFAEHTSLGVLPMRKASVSWPGLWKPQQKS